MLGAGVGVADGAWDAGAAGVAGAVVDVVASLLGWATGSLSVGVVRDVVVLVGVVGSVWFLLMVLAPSLICC